MQVSTVNTFVISLWCVLWFYLQLLSVVLFGFSKDNMIHLLVNKWKCKDGTILHSHSTHDYVCHTDANGEFSFVDGGTSYIRHSGNMEPILVYSTDPHSKIRDNFEWTSYGINGDEEPKVNLLKDLTTEHISAIIQSQKHLPEHITKVFNDELTYRSNEQ